MSWRLVIIAFSCLQGIIKELSLRLGVFLNLQLTSYQERNVSLFGWKKLGMYPGSQGGKATGKSL